MTTIYPSTGLPATQGLSETITNGGRISASAAKSAWTVLDWPRDGMAEMALVSPENTRIGAALEVSMLGHRGKLKWDAHPDGLRVWFPKKRPCEFAYGLKIKLAKK